MQGAPRQEWAQAHVQREGTVGFAPSYCLSEFVRGTQDALKVHSKENIPEVSKSLKTRTQDKMLLLNATKKMIMRDNSNDRYENCQRNVPAIAREKPVLDALSGAKYSNHTARAVTSRVPARSTRTVTHL